MKMRHKRYLTVALIWAVVLAVIGVALWMTILSYSDKSDRNLRAQAVLIADGAPFCVQVAQDDVRRGRGQTYRPVVAPRDTTFPQMRGQGGHHHAVLVVGQGLDPRTYHWSYFKQSFVAGTYGPFPIVCQPSRRYFEEARDDSAGPLSTFLLAGRRLSIPWVYRPRPHWPGSMVGYSFSASPPDFKPVDQADSLPDRRGIYVAFERGGKPFGIHQGKPYEAIKTGETPERGELAGLTRLAATRPQEDDLIRRDEHGTIVTDISCSSDCLHQFSEDGVTFSFHHARKDLPAWRAMQERLLALHRQFMQHE